MRKWINIITESTGPSLVYDQATGSWAFSGFGVSAQLQGDPENLGVIAISAADHHRGNAQTALQWLRTKCENLGVYDAGQPGDPTYEFWAQMANKGLVDWLMDETGTPIYVDGKWRVRH